MLYFRFINSFIFFKTCKGDTDFFYTILNIQNVVGSSIDVWENLYRETVLVRVQVLISANIDKVLARLQADIKGNN